MVIASGGFGKSGNLKTLEEIAMQDPVLHQAIADTNLSLANINEMTQFAMGGGLLSRDTQESQLWYDDGWRFKAR